MSAVPESQLENLKPRPIACYYCRSKKIRCDHRFPCANCIDRREHCTYPAEQRAQRRGKRKGSDIERRLARIERLSGEPSRLDDGSSGILPNALPLEDVQPSRNQQLSEVSQSQSSTWSHPLSHKQSIVPPEVTPASWQTSPGLIPTSASTILSPKEVLPQSVTLPQRPPSTFRHITSIESRPSAQSQISPPAVVPTGNASQTTTSEESPFWEYHGVKWVSETTGQSSFGGHARDFIMQIGADLKLSRKPNSVPFPEPDRETAWRYCTAYFDHSFDATFGIILRSEFEARLCHSTKEAPLLDENPAWYALRNTVFATGSRIDLSMNSPSSTFQEIQACSWQFFENAMSVHTELLYCPSGLMAVQALIAMSFFVDGIGSPALEYMLLSCALRLAQSKGLHTQATESWLLSASDVNHRNRLFWTLYMFEQHISHRSGRPSMINDDDIGCQVPLRIPSELPSELDLFAMIVEHARISSRISKGLATRISFRQTPKKVFETVHELSSALEQWRASLPSFLQPEAPIRRIQTLSGLHNYHIFYMRFAYYGSILAIHSIFTYPWNKAVFGDDYEPVLLNQIAFSNHTVVNAARKIILDVNHIQVDGGAPLWLALHFPVASTIHLFIYIIKFPTLPSIDSDLALMDIAVGYFARIEFITSVMHFPFIRELARLARVVVASARDKETMTFDDSPALGEKDTLEESAKGSGNNLLNNIPDDTLIDFYTDEWGMLQPLGVMDRYV